MMRGQSKAEERVLRRIEERTKEKSKEGEYFFRRGRVLWKLKEQNIPPQQIEQRFELEMMLEEEEDKKRAEISSIRKELIGLGFTTPEVNNIIKNRSVGK